MESRISIEDASMMSSFGCKMEKEIIIFFILLINYIGYNS
jgi:hypothetical protein